MESLARLEVSLKFLSFRLNIFVNEIWFHEVLIDPHVFERHGESITEELVLNLVDKLHMERNVLDSIDERGNRYFVTDDLIIDGKSYRMIWLIPSEKNFIGVRTVFRRKHGKKI